MTKQAAGRVAAGGKRPILIILHQGRSNPGRVGQHLRAQGYLLDIRRPKFGQPLPETLEEHAGVVLFGGPASANDVHLPFLKREYELIELAMTEGRPFLGICLGAQMLARQLGGTVGQPPCKSVEAGYYEIEPVGDNIIGALPERVFQWHGEGFALPSNVSPLAQATGVFPNQAFCDGSAAIGLQFHPEITYHMVHRWTALSPQRLTQPGAQPRKLQLEHHRLLAPSVSRWLDGFLRRWLSLDTAS